MSKLSTARCRCALFVLLFVAFQHGHAGAQVSGEIRLQFAAEQPVWVGQQVTLNLDLLTTGFSFGDQQFLLPEVSGGFLLQTDTTTIKLTERRGGETWQMLRYPIAFFPQRAGRLTISAFRVSFAASAGFGQQPQRFSFLTEAVSLDVTRPPGIEDDGLLVTSAEFDLRATWSPQLMPEADGEPATARLGDAITLEVTQSAADISGMVLPGLPVHRAPGLAAYPQAPRVEDKVARGTLRGARTDSVTWVFEQPGRYDFPEIRYRWFDPSSRQVRESLVPGLALNVVAQAGLTGGGAGSQAARWALGNGWGWVTLLVLLAAGAGVSWRYLIPRLDASRQHRKRQLDAGEPALFRAALAACRHHDAATAYAALSRWAQRCGTAEASKSLIAFAAGYDPAFRQSVEALQRALVDGAAWDGGQLADMLPRVRRQLGTGSPSAPAAALAPLNPGKA